MRKIMKKIIVNRQDNKKVHNPQNFYSLICLFNAKNVFSEYEKYVKFVNIKYLFL